VSMTYKVRGDLSQDRPLEGLPRRHPRGHRLFAHNFRSDGEYVFKFSLLEGELRPPVTAALPRRAIETERQRPAACCCAICRRSSTTTFARRCGRAGGAAVAAPGRWAAPPGNGSGRRT
jgi:hypothetical protein